MSRSGYSDGCDGWELIRWRGAVKSAMSGRRGKAFLQELLAALDALPEKRLIAGAMEDGHGVCALGCVGRQRGLDMTNLDPYERDDVGSALGIAGAMAAEIMYWNDEMYARTPEDRYALVRRRVEAALAGEVE